MSGHHTRVVTDPDGTVVEVDFFDEPRDRDVFLEVKDATNGADNDAICAVAILSPAHARLVGNALLQAADEADA